jgi:hypothetical protein
MAYQLSSQKKVGCHRLLLDTSNHCGAKVPPAFFREELVAGQRRPDPKNGDLRRSDIWPTAPKMK